MTQGHVLFLEDEEFIRIIVVELLVEAGFQVTEAADGERALGLLDEHHEFDVLLADVQMPGRYDGVDVARHVRSHWPQIPVVFVTARPDSLHAFGASGPRDRCIKKPYRPTDVLAALHASLGLATRTFENNRPPGSAGT